MLTHSSALNPNILWNRAGPSRLVRAFQECKRRLLLKWNKRNQGFSDVLARIARNKTTRVRHQGALVRKRRGRACCLSFLSLPTFRL
jgi:hypothetical protein